MKTSPHSAEVEPISAPPTASGMIEVLTVTVVPTIVLAEFAPMAVPSIAPPSMLIASKAALSMKFALVIFLRVPPAPSSITTRSASAIVVEAVMF